MSALPIRGLAGLIRALPVTLGLLIAAHPPSLAAGFRAVEPAEGVTVGPRPVFRFSAPTGWVADGGAIIELSRDRWKTIDKAWDMRISRRGWDALPEPLDRSGAFQCSESLGEGAWEWRVRASGDLIDEDAPRTVSFNVDATPPAEIEGLKLDPRDDGSILLTWEPVTRDVEGKPETIDHYVVYRYRTRGTFPQTAPMVIGRTTILSYLDGPARSGSSKGPEKQTGAVEGRPIERDVVTDGASSRPSSGKRGTEAAGKPKAPGGDPVGVRGSEDSLYYKVVAVDVAGNELGIRELPPPASQPRRPK